MTTGYKVINMDTIVEFIRTGREKMLKLAATPTEVRMPTNKYVELIKEVGQYLVSPPFEINTDIILDKDGNQIPNGQIYGLDIYIDNKLPHEQIIIK